MNSSSRAKSQSSDAVPCRYWRIQNLPGLSAEYQQQLIDIGIENTLQLLQRGKTQVLRQQLANQLNLHVQHVNRWVALADLAQVPDVGCQHCGVLLHSGIASMQVLANTSPQQLFRQTRKFYVANLQRMDLCPKVEDISRWIAQARSLCQSVYGS